MKIAVAAAIALLAGGSAAAQGFDCDQERSRQEVQRLTQSGIVVSVDPFVPDVTVVVEERAWKRADAAARKSIAQHIDCAVLGPKSSMLSSIFFRSNRSNRPLGEFSRGELTQP
jgi:hypothetical protein